jgi:hypothetical protein
MVQRRNIPASRRTRIGGARVDSARPYRDELPIEVARPDALPNYLTNRRGTHWGTSLKAAYKRGAVIISEEYGYPVIYDPLPGSKKSFRPWRKKYGKARFDHRECIPTW